MKYRIKPQRSAFPLGCHTLNGESLRQYLKGLPDFDDIEAEERAKTIAMGHPSLLAALAFLINWPDLPAAAKLIETRHAELDGNAYHTLTPAADALEADHPLAATLAYRAMITHSLKNNRTKRYAYAARHLSHCASLENEIVDHQDAPDHASFMDGLRQAHGRKTSFWNLLETE